MCDDVVMTGLARVFATSDHFEGELMRGRLESEGVPVLLKGDGSGPYHAGAVYLFVPAEDETRARAIIDAIASGAYAVDADEAFDAPQVDDANRR
jgi:Putative prokaryotic signal transducing protein